MREVAFLLITVFCGSFVQNVFAENETEKSLMKVSLINQIIDLAVQKIKEDVSEPTNLTDVIKQFKKKILLIPIDAEIILHEGRLWGVKTIKRCSDSTFDLHGLKVDVNISFQFDLLQFTYDFRANIFKVSSDGILKGNVTQLVSEVGLFIDLEKRTIELKALRLVKAKVLRIQIDSEKYADKFINYMLKLITSNLKSILLSQIEKELQFLINEKIHFISTT